MAIHPTAVVEPGAQVDPSCDIGPYAVVGKDVVLGPGNVLAAHAIVSGRIRRFEASGAWVTLTIKRTKEIPNANSGF